MINIKINIIEGSQITNFCKKYHVHDRLLSFIKYI